MADAGKKLADALEPTLTALLNNAVAKIIEQINTTAGVRQQQVLIDIGDVATRLKVVETLLAAGGSAPKVKRSTKKTDADSTAEVAPADAQPAVEQPAAATGGNLPANAYIKFAQDFKASADFRKNYEDLLEAANADESVSKKKTAEEKYNPQARFIWNMMKDKKDPRYAEYSAKFAAEKKARETAGKGPAQTKEANSPK